MRYTALSCSPVDARHQYDMGDDHVRSSSRLRERQVKIREQRLHLTAAAPRVTLVATLGQNGCQVGRRERSAQAEEQEIAAVR